jgi:hypothetical protein
MMYGIPIYLLGFMDVFFLFSKKTVMSCWGCVKAPGLSQKMGLSHKHGGHLK